MTSDLDGDGLDGCMASRYSQEAMGTQVAVTVFNIYFFCWVIEFLK